MLFRFKIAAAPQLVIHNYWAHIAEDLSHKLLKLYIEVSVFLILPV